MSLLRLEGERRLWERKERNHKRSWEELFLMDSNCMYWGEGVGLACLSVMESGNHLRRYGMHITAYKNGIGVN